MRSLLVGILFFGGIGPLISRASYFQSPVNDVKLGNLEVISESGQKTDLTKIIASDKSILLVPAYFSCNSTCPLIASNLRAAFNSLPNKSDLTVLILSFNQTDGPEQIKRFRKHHNLPSSWTLAVAERESDIKELLNPLGYQFQKTGIGFDHPNSAFFFSRKKKLWSGIITGTDNKATDLRKALIEAGNFDNEKFNPTLIRYLAKTEYLVIISFVGLLISLLTIIIILVRKSKKVSMPTDTING